MTDIHNPMGTDGFEFIEYTAPDPELLRNLFEKMGFPATAKHRSKNVTLHSQAISISSSTPNRAVLPGVSRSSTGRPFAPSHSG